MSRRVLGLSLIVAMLAVALLSGCGKSGGKVIARVGSDKITAEDFNDLFSSVGQTFRTAQDEFDYKAIFLDSMVIQRMLVQAAYEKGMDKSEAVAQAVLENKDKFLLDILYQQEVQDRVSITDAELKDYYNKLANKIHVAHILIADEDTAKALVQRIAQGANFEQLAYDYSLDPNAKRSRGDLGYMLWGGMASLPQFEDAAFKLGLGQVSPPIKSRIGYHIIKIVDIQPNDQRGEFDKVKPNLEKSLRSIQENRLMINYIEKIMDKYPITVDTTTCAYLVHKRQEMYPPEVLQSFPKYDFDDSQLDRNERELVIATWQGGPVTVIDYLGGVRKLPAQMRPSLDQYDSLKQAVFQLKLQDILTYEANKTGVENDDRFKRKVALFKELTMADMLKTDSIMRPPTPDESQLRKYYDEHQAEFTDEPRAHVYEIQVSDELLANKLAKQIRSLDAFKAKAKEVNERQGRRDQGGDLGYIIRNWYPEIFDVAWKTPVGDIGGPVVAGGKYSIIYVVDKVDRTVRDFLGVKQVIAGQIMNQEASTRFVNWIQERKGSTRIEIDSTALWSTISKEKYAATDSTAAQTGK